jgi:hypothetical protein
MKIKLIKFVSNPFAIRSWKKPEIIEEICLACYPSFSGFAWRRGFYVYSSFSEEKANGI